MSNFTFLKTDWPDLYEMARESEQNVKSAPRTSCFYARRSLVRAVKWLYANDSYLQATLCRQHGHPDPPTFRETWPPASSPRFSPSRKSATVGMHKLFDLIMSVMYNLYKWRLL